MSSAEKRTPVAARTVFSSPIHLLAFGFGAGLAPVAPGTFGSLVGVAAWLGLRVLPVWSVISVTTLMFIAGCAICGASARQLRVHDHSGIVFDEIVGIWIAALPLLAAPRTSFAWLLAAFALFRLFDIWKPWPIGWLDRRVHGGTGIMLDDVVAGIYAAALLGVARAIMPLFPGR